DRDWPGGRHRTVGIGHILVLLRLQRRAAPGPGLEPVAPISFQYPPRLCVLRPPLVVRCAGMTFRTRFNQYARRLWRWLTLDGLLRAVQPWVFLLGPIALILALIAPYRGLFVIAYTYLLLVAGLYLGGRGVGARGGRGRRVRGEWAEGGGALAGQGEGVTK